MVVKLNDWSILSKNIGALAISKPVLKRNKNQFLNLN